MKSIKQNISIAFSAIALFILVGSTNVHAQQENVSFQLFYDQLAPYGEWIDDPDYGYIWLPDVDQNFQPYATNGYWVNTQYGNTWYSNYDWGWAPFHYGRWISSDYYGWAWVPGYEWGPAWVSWRQGGGQYGWAPLGPGMSFSMNINIPLRNWIFVPQRYFFNSNIYRYYTPYGRYNSFYGRTTIINNVYVYNNNRYYSGPDRRSLERYTRNRVDVREFKNSSRPGRNSITNRSVEMYRPNIRSSGNQNARPSRVVSKDQVQTRAQVNSSNRTGTSTRPTRGNANAAATTKNVRPSRAQSTATDKKQNNATSRPSRATRSSTNTNQTQQNRESKASSRPARATRPSTNTNQTQQKRESNASSRPARATRPSTNTNQYQQKRESNASSRPARATRPSANTTQARSQSSQRSTSAPQSRVTTSSNPRPAASRSRTRDQASAPRVQVQSRTSTPSQARNSGNNNRTANNQERKSRPSRNN